VRHDRAKKQAQKSQRTSTPGTAASFGSRIVARSAVVEDCAQLSAATVPSTAQVSNKDTVSLAAIRDLRPMRTAASYECDTFVVQRPYSNNIESCQELNV
jgi:hypothetical protein